MQIRKEWFWVCRKRSGGQCASMRSSFAKLNTLIYVLRNRRTLQRVLDMQSRVAAG